MVRSDNLKRVCHLTSAILLPLLLLASYDIENRQNQGERRTTLDLWMLVLLSLP